MTGTEFIQDQPIQITPQVICDLYQSFYKKKYGNEKYKFLPTEKANKAIGDFLLLIKKHYNLHSIGNKFIIHYFIFQFDRVEHLTFHRFSTKKDNVVTVGGKIQIHDIIGKKAFSYWLGRNEAFDFKLNESFFVLKSNITIGDLITKKTPIQEKETIISLAEEIERKRFLNSERGLLHCMEITSLFYHRSSTCVSCIYRANCKKILQQTKPIIYKQRNY